MDSCLPGLKTPVIRDSYCSAHTPHLNLIVDGGCVHLRYSALRARRGLLRFSQKLLHVGCILVCRRPRKFSYPLPHSTFPAAGYTRPPQTRAEPFFTVMCVDNLRNNIQLIFEIMRCSSSKKDFLY